MKTCNACKTEKDFSAFYKRKDAYKDPYRSDCNACLKIKAANRYKANPKKYNEMGAKWRSANPELNTARGFRYRKAKRLEIRARIIKWGRENPDKIRAKQQRYHAQHPWIRPYHCMKRRMAKAKASPAWLTRAHKREILAFYIAAQEASKTTKVPHHVDHIIPIRGRKVCGLHVPWNLRIITAEENLRKSNLLIDP